MDIWGNLHYQTLQDELDEGMDVRVTATWVNHDNYLSPILVPDMDNWQSVYGKVITGSTVDANDGTLTASIMIYRAATYRLNIDVDGV